MCGKDQYHHVLFVSWPSGMLESFKDAIYNYDQGEWDTKTAHLLFPAKSIAEVASIVGKSPFNYLKTVAEFLKSASLSTDDRQTYCDADWRKRFNWESKYEKAILVDKICDPKKNHNERAEDAKYVATFPARLITTPAIGPMGRTMWDNMVARARFAFRRPCDLWDTDTRLGTPTNPTDANCGKGAAGIMFNAMQCAFNPESVSCVKHGKGDRRGKVGFDLTMIGHSMGTIVASEGINDYPNLPYKNIVFLGAAVSIREFLASVQPALQSRNMEFLNNTDDQSRQSESAIIDLVDVLKSANTPGAPDKSVKEVLTSIKSGYLREMDRLLQQRRGLSPTQSKRLDIIKIKLAKLQNIENSGIASLNSLRTAEKIIPEKPIYFYNLSLHPHAEARGTEFSGAVPSGSLLEWIDSFYTTPSDILERTMGKWVNVMNSYWAFDEDLLVPDPETRKISKDEKLEPIMHFKRFNLQDTSPRWHSCLAKANGDFNYWEENYWKSTSDAGNGNDSGKPGESAVCTPT